MKEEKKNKETSKYLDLLRERGKEKRVTKLYQAAGLTIAEILGDEEHKSLYIKMAKEYNYDFLISLAKDVAQRKNIENKGAYFMTLFEKYKRENGISNNGK